MDEGEAELDVLHLLFGIFAVPGIERHRTALGVRHQERQFAGADDREPAGLIAGIDVSDVGDPVARHVVMVERLAELLRRENLGLDRAAGCLFDRRTPIFQGLLQRMRRRYPVRQFELEGLFLRPSSRYGRGHTGGEQQRQKRFPHRHILPWWMEPGYKAPVSLFNMLYRSRGFSSRSWFGNSLVHSSGV